MADISKITPPGSQTTYNLKDAAAREQAAENKNNISSLLLSDTSKTGDLNDVTANEFALYTGQSTHLPTQSFYYVHTTTDSSANSRLQEAFEMVTGEAYVRTYAFDMWSAWKLSNLNDTQLAAVNSGIDSTKVDQIGTNTAILSQTYNSADCNISLILRQDSTEDLYVHYDTDARKLYMPYKAIKNQYKYWKDGVEYLKYHILTDGVIMTNNSAKCNMLTSDTPEVTNETYNRSWVATDDGGSAVTTAFNLTKANSEIGDVWYTRPYIIYDDLETGMRYKMYGPVYKITAGTPCTVECATLSCTELTTAVQQKIGASDYATQYTGGTVRVWTTTSGGETTLHISNEAP